MNRKKLAVRIMALLIILSAAMTSPVVTVKASAENYTDVGGLLGDVKDKLSEAVSQLDEDTMKEIFDFLEEKVKDGSLKTDTGLSGAIKEGETKFGFSVSEQDARKVVDTMEKLEDLGFSAEYVLEKSEELYDKYGADFVNHVDEVAAGAVQDAVTNAASGFFSNLWNSVQNFFKNLFSGL